MTVSGVNTKSDQVKWWSPSLLLGVVDFSPLLVNGAVFQSSSFGVVLLSPPTFGFLEVVPFPNIVL